LAIVIPTNSDYNQDVIDKIIDKYLIPKADVNTLNCKCPKDVFSDFIRSDGGLTMLDYLPEWEIMTNPIYANTKKYKDIVEKRKNKLV